MCFAVRAPGFLFKGKGGGGKEKGGKENGGGGGADAYVYGALCKTGWKPKKKKRSMLGPTAKILQ